MLKSILVVAGLAVFLGLIFLVHRSLEDAKSERVIVGWSNSLIWSALRTEAAPRYRNPVLEPAAQPNQWRVSGELVYREPDGTVVEQPYRAVVNQVCPLRQRQECWSLAALELGNVTVDLSVAAQEEDQNQDDPEALPADTADSAAVDRDEPGAAVAEGAPAGDFGSSAVPSDQVTPIKATPAEAVVEPGDPAVSEPEAVEVLDRQTLVLRIQQRLDALGFDTGVPDGQFGPRTRAAIRSYLDSRGLTGDDAPSPELLRQLEAR